MMANSGGLGDVEKDFKYQAMHCDDEHLKIEDNPVGAGLMGKVYPAMFHHQPVVVKLLQKLSHGAQPDSRDPFFTDNHTEKREKIMEDEFNLLSALRFRTIVQVLALYRGENGNMGIVMEKMDISLFDRCRDTPRLLPFEVGSIFSDVASGLEYMHKLRVIHRDISPSNILLRTINGQLVAKLCDCHNSKNAAQLPQPRSGNDLRQETMRYAAPELIERDRYDMSVDIYSFGVVLTDVHLLPGNTVHALPEHHEADVEKMGNMLGHDHPFVRLANDCVKKEPNKRPNASEVILQLDKVKQDPLFQPPRSDSHKPANSILMEEADLPVSNTCQDCPKLEEMCKERDDRLVKLTNDHSRELREQEEKLTREKNKAVEEERTEGKKMLKEAEQRHEESLQLVNKRHQREVEKKQAELQHMLKGQNEQKSALAEEDKRRLLAQKEQFDREQNDLQKKFLAEKEDMEAKHNRALEKLQEELTKAHHEELKREKEHLVAKEKEIHQEMSEQKIQMANENDRKIKEQCEEHHKELVKLKGDARAFHEKMEQLFAEKLKKKDESWLQKLDEEREKANNLKKELIAERSRLDSVTFAKSHADKKYEDLQVIKDASLQTMKTKHTAEIQEIRSINDRKRQDAEQTHFAEIQRLQKIVIDHKTVIEDLKLQMKRLEEVREITEEQKRNAQVTFSDKLAIKEEEMEEEMRELKKKAEEEGELQLSNFNEEKRRLKDEMDELRVRLATLEREVTTLRQSLEQNDAHLKHAYLQQAEGHRKEMKRLEERKKDEVALLKLGFDEEKASWEKKSKEKEKELRRFTGVERTLRDDCARLESEVKSSTNASSELKRALQREYEELLSTAKEGYVQRTNSLSKSHDEELMVKDEELTRLSLALQEEQASVSSLKETCRQLKGALEEEGRHHNERLQEQISEHNDRLKEREKELKAEAAKDMDELCSRLVFGKFNGQTEESQDELSSLHQHLKEVEEENRKLLSERSAFTNAKEESARLKGEVDKLRDCLETHKEESAKLEAVWQSALAEANAKIIAQRNEQNKTLEEANSRVGALEEELKKRSKEYSLADLGKFFW